VHEILSREAIEQVPFNEIVDDLIRVASDTARTLSRPVEFQVNGDARELPAQLATPLALVIQELLANAVEHAFPDRVEGDGEAAVLPGHVAIDLDNDGEILRVCIRDDGAGLPADFSLETSASLGLSITRTLVTTQLNGTMVMSGDTGTEVEIEIPVIDESGNP
jgi:two-component sensor histidine kinase